MSWSHLIKGFALFFPVINRTDWRTDFITEFPPQRPPVNLGTRAGENEVLTCHVRRSLGGPKTYWVISLRIVLFIRRISTFGALLLHFFFKTHPWKALQKTTVNYYCDRDLIQRLSIGRACTAKRVKYDHAARVRVAHGVHNVHHLHLLSVHFGHTPYPSGPGCLAWSSMIAIIIFFPFESKSQTDCWWNRGSFSDQNLTHFFAACQKFSHQQCGSSYYSTERDDPTMPMKTHVVYGLLQQTLFAFGCIPCPMIVWFRRSTQPTCC